ncbi:MAG: PKD domain-containing protein [Chitinophagaceae bacterium]|nr:PKD domain-containing protein [Chitinophagaceae bacterium]
MKGFSFQCLRIAFYLLPLLFLSNFGNSQTHTKKTVSIPNGRCNGYWEYLPINYNSNTTAKYPLIIYIHGAGSYGNGSSSALDLVAREGVTRIINLNLFPSTFIVNGQVTSFIAISPQFISKPTPQEIGKVIDFILNRGYRIDSKRIYLTGFSNGGDGVWKAPYNLAAAERLTAIIPVAGYNSPYYDTTAKFIAAGNLPVWAVHSPSDGVPILWTTNMVNKIKSFNPQVPPVFTKPAGLTHEQTHEVVYDPSYRPNGKNFYEWCLQYTRNVNAPPLANAGNDLTITYPLRQVTLNGNASSDPDNDPLVYSWRKTTGPSSFNFNNSSISNPTVSNLVAGTYQFELTVTDIANNSDKDSVLVTVVNPTPNILPIAIAENDITIATPMPISLIGSNSYDIDGIIETYFWSKISGPSQFTIQNPALSNTGISNLRAGIYKFQLLVSDNQGGTGFDTVVITVLNNLPNIPPIANAGSDQTITLPLNSVSLSGNGSSDIDGNIVSYFWRQINGPSNAALGSPDNSTTNAGNLLVGTYQFELTVMDDSTSSDKDTVQIGVNPIPVVTQKFIKVNIYGGSFPAGTGWNNWNVLNNLTLGSTTYSDGTNSSMTAVLNLSSAVSDNGSTYPVTMCPIEVGRTTSYSTVVRTITLSGLNNNREYSLEVYASRAKTGNSTRFTVGSSSVSINTDYNYSNKALFTSITPVNGKVVLKIERLANYNYINGFILTELDGSPPPNQSPVAVAGNSQTITLPNSSVTLNGSLSYDPDGTIVSYNWTKLSGPSAVINSNNSAITTVSQLTQGVYLFQLTVTDNIGATASSNVQVIVNEEYIPPVGQDSLNCGKIFKIVVLGSSTAIGTGATPIDSAWVNKMRFYVRGKNLQSQIINLAASGFTTYHTLNPTGFIPLPGRPEPDSNRNITKALSYSPDLIIINLPSNDNASNFSVQEQMDNYERAMALANSNNTPVWVTTPQPRNNFNSTQVSNQLAVRDWTLQRFAEKAIDFWEGIANPDGTINELYNFDGIHVNTAGHHIFYSRAVAERMLDTLCLRKNTEPIAKAGNDVSILFPLDSLQLNGTGSTDPDGSIVSYQWLKINGPSCTIINPSSAITMITGMHVGVYEFQVKVTDNYGAVSFDSVTATVTSPIPQPPVANAGMDTVLILPVNNTQLNGTGSFDPDGTITSYNWREVAGSSTYLLTDSLSAIANVTDMEAGIYIFELTVLDSNGMFDLDSVTITVAEPPNQPPDANAGVDLVIAYPGTAAQLNGSLSVDSDGTIVGYMWTKFPGLYHLQLIIFLSKIH